jgi:hypothetical protein
MANLRHGGILAMTAALIISLAPAAALGQVKPGDRITATNAGRVRNLVSPGVYVAVTKGMELDVVPTSRVNWPPPYKEATEKYSAQVRLSGDHRSLVGYVAGQPFPLLDLNDPYIATKIMWNSEFRPIGTDDSDLRFFECQVQYARPGGTHQILDFSELGHLAGYSNIGRTEVEPLPVDPDFRRSGIWSMAGAYPTIAPDENRGDGGLRYRYWDADRGDDAWSYSNASRRLRRVNEVILSSATGFTTWDPDHVGGFAAKPQEYNYKFLGERQMLGCAHAARSPEHPCPSDGGATTCPENWEMRRLYVIQVTPRPSRIGGALQSKTVVYIDTEMWFNPYVDSYDRRGDLWKTQIYWLTYRDRPVPDARVAIYPFPREFVVAAASMDVQTGLSTACYLPGPDTPERECWYINMGAVSRDFFTPEAMVRAGH